MEPTLDDVLRQLDGIGRLLMSIDANLQKIVDVVEGDDGEEEADS